MAMTQHFDTRAGRLAAALDEFIHSSPDVEAAAVVSFDGLPMASALPDELEEDRVGAMSAALLSLGEQAAMGLGRGQLNQVFVEGENGFVFLMSARDQAVLAAVARRTAKIGFMLFEMRRAADRIGHALEPVAVWESPVVDAPTVPAAASPPPPQDDHRDGDHGPDGHGREQDGHDEAYGHDREEHGSDGHGREEHGHEEAYGLDGDHGDDHEDRHDARPLDLVPEHAVGDPTYSG
jgi:predicted regulator of Ras-like GTPase activity (Roadblock/LC7/MglB family)